MCIVCVCVEKICEEVIKSNTMPGDILEEDKEDKQNENIFCRTEFEKLIKHKEYLMEIYTQTGIINLVAYFVFIFFVFGIT